MTKIVAKINGVSVTKEVEDRTSLADFLREQLFLTGTHLGCEHGVCGACSVLLDGEPVRSCVTLAASVDGREIQTIEGFEDDHEMAVIRECFSEAHGLQCGYCTPGMLITVRDMIRRDRCQDEAQIRAELAGNLCRCTGYVGIVEATQMAYARLRAAGKPVSG